jgi:pimeloyl-ACP methyl ester carboxylesterase
MRHHATRTLAIVIVASGLTCAGSAAAFDVREIGSFHVGGRTITLEGLPVRELFYTSSAGTPLKVDPNGDYQVEQMYVQYVKLAQPQAKYPLLMVHGGGMTGVNWETTPDGRPGFQMYFLQHGHDVYISDSVERGRASFARPEIWKSEPFFPVAKATWELARVGPPSSYQTDPAKRVAYPDSKFPIAAFDQLMKERVPRWTTNDAAAQTAYDLYVQRVCPCVIMAHSTGGPFALNMALHAPDKIKALILLEPAGAPDPANGDIGKLKGVPHLYVWADHTSDEPSMKVVIPLAVRWRDALNRIGAPVEWIELPKLGIAGNTHVMMMDVNNLQIADLIQSWMGKQGLMK